MGIYIEYDKPFLTYDEQIDRLSNHYNLIIEDSDIPFARSALSTISYYDLVNGYQEYTMQNGVFKAGTTLRYLFHYYLFDKDIQNIMLKNSLLVENIFKTKLSYVLAKNFGVDVYDYLNPKYFKNNIRRNIYFEKVKREIFKRINKFKPQPTLYYKKHHNHIPPWILLRNVEFGNAINLYRLLKSPYKEELAKSLIKGNNNQKLCIDFSLSALNFIKNYRNDIAHNLKFGSSHHSLLPFNTTLKIINNPEITDGISEFNNLYAYILAIHILLNEPVLQAKLYFDLSGTLLPKAGMNVNALSVHSKIVLNYLTANKMPLNFGERLNILLPQETN